jgi:acyl-coenzyme A synthetase/AMP-(fatty) acid ligase
LPHTKLFITYGVSEAGNVSLYEFSTGEIREHCVGISSKGVRVCFQNDDGEIFRATKENPGRILVESDGVMLGYWGDNSLSESVLVNPHTLKTSDIGYADLDENIYVLGRFDDVFDIGGYKVSPLEIESLVMTRQDVKECLCVIDENRVAVKILKLLVVMKTGRKFSEKALYSYLTERMEIFKVPKCIVQVNEIPRENKLYKPIRRVQQ